MLAPSSEGRLQLGTLVLTFDDSGIDGPKAFEAGSSTGPGTLTSTSDWETLNVGLVDSLLTGHTSDPDLSSQLRTVRTLLADDGLGPRLTYKRKGAELVIRVEVTPSDITGSRWKRYGDTRRRLDALVVLFRYLKRTWDITDDRSEEDDGFVLGLTDEDDLNMLDLYAAVPSPPSPIFKRCRWKADDEVKQRLAEFENPLGVQTPLYQYQVVSRPSFTGS